MADQEKKEATARPIEAFSEASQALTESLVTAQQRNVKYAQSVFDSTIALLKDQVSHTRSVLEQWEQQAQKQLRVPEAAEGSFSFLRAPLDAYERVIEVMETASKQSLEGLQKATESLEKAMQQGREQVQEVARRASHLTEKPGK